MSKKINYHFLLFGSMYIIMGIVSLIKGATIPTIIISLLGFILLIKAIIALFMMMFKKNNHITKTIINSLLEVTFGLFLIFNTKIALSFISIIFALYLLLFTIIDIITLSIYLTNNIAGKISLLIHIIINTTFFFLLITSPYQNLEIAIAIISIYFILYGISNIGDFIVDTIPLTAKNKIKYQIHIPLPIALAAIIPPQLIKRFNKAVDIKNDNHKNTSKQNINLEIIIHLAESGTASFGHVDIAYKNKIYSYGNYDRHSRMMLDAIGDGVFMIADKSKYIKYMIEKQHRYLIVYGLNLNDNQQKLLDKTINETIYTKTVDWDCDLNLYQKGKIGKAKFNDMSSELVKFAEAKFRKVVKGKNKKFFVFKTNCTLVAETLIRPLGRAVLPISGLITPGTYYDCLEREFHKNNSNVISKNIFYKKSNQK